MSVWSTRSLGRDRDYVVIKHALPGINYVIKGVKFRDGYAVVEKSSKTYYELKKMPQLHNAPEFPLVFLRKLKFILRTMDVKTIFGEDVYRMYIKQLNSELTKEKQEEQQVAEIVHIESAKCAYRTPQGQLCEHNALDVSPSGYCKRHILLEPKLSELGIVIPTFIPKKDRAELKEQVIEKLSKLKK